MQFKKAILREIPDTYQKCISSHPLHGTISLQKAREQHKNYRKLLEELGLETILIEKNNIYPDSCFIEDTAIIHKNKAVITRLARESRQGEEDAVEEILKDYKSLKRIVAPGTIEGGDVIHLENRLISGITSRTNLEGVKQAQDWLGVKIDVIEDKSIVHLKSYVTYLGDGFFVSTEKYAKHPLLEGYEVIVVPAGEEYGANTLSINGVVIMSEGHQKLARLVTEHGFDVVTLDMSEFEKCEGALTCLSLRF